MVDINNPAMVALLPGNVEPLANGMANNNQNINRNNQNINRAQHNRIGFFNRFRRLFDKKLEVINVPKTKIATNNYTKLEDELGDLLVEDIVLNDGIQIVKDQTNNVNLKVGKLDIEVNLETYRRLLESKDRILQTPAELRDRLKHSVIKSLSKTIDKDLVIAYLAELYNEDDNIIQVETETGNAFTQTNASIDVQVDEEDIIGTTKYKIPIRKVVNKKVKHVNNVNMLSPLTYHLKSKYFMSLRTVELINNMVRDARIWMAANKFSLTNQDDYYLMTQSIMAAFLIDEQELKFRQLLKNHSNYDNMVHINNTLSGNLGRTNRLFPLRERGLISSAMNYAGLTVDNKFSDIKFKI